MKTDFAKADLIETISGYTELTKSGNYYTGFCPVHENVNTPALVVYPNDGPESAKWVCFAGCTKPEGGDVIDFIMAVEGISFKEALKFVTQQIQPSRAFLRELEQEKTKDVLETIVLFTLRQAELVDRLGVIESLGILQEVDEMIMERRFVYADKILSRCGV